MLNIEKYKDEIIAEWRESEESDLLEDISVVAIRHGKSLGSIEQVVDWLCSEYKEPLLDGEEKEFLQDLMKWYGFESLKKDGVRISMYVRISDGVSNYMGSVSAPFDTDKGFYKFQNLEDDKTYTLEELGL